MSEVHVKSPILNVSGQQIVPHSGNIIQCNYVRSDTLTTFIYSYREYYESTNQNFPIKLRLDNVSNPNNWVMCQWQMSGESNSQSNFGFYVLKNGSFIPRGAGSGPGDGNPGTGQYWMHHQGGGYDGDDSSTPHTMFFTYFGKIGQVGSVEYTLRFADGGGNDCTYYMNRTVSSAGANNYENGVSVGVIYELGGDVGTSSLSGL